MYRLVEPTTGEALIGSNGLHVHVDYLWHPWVIATQSAFDLVLYVGVGGRFLDHDRGRDDDDDFHLGPRVPFGMLFDFTPAASIVGVTVIREAALSVELSAR